MLKEMGACMEAIKIIRHYETAQEWWDQTKRPDWMFLLIENLSGKKESDKRRKLVLIACKCARLALPYVEKDEKRPLEAIETAEAWAKCENGITLEQVRNVTAAAYAYAATADDGYAPSSAYVTAYAAAYVAAASTAIYAAGDAYAYAHSSESERKHITADCVAIIKNAYPDIDDLF